MPILAKDTMVWLHGLQTHLARLTFPSWVLGRICLSLGQWSPRLRWSEGVFGLSRVERRRPDATGRSSLAECLGRANAQKPGPRTGHLEPHGRSESTRKNQLVCVSLRGSERGAMPIFRSMNKYIFNKQTFEGLRRLFWTLFLNLQANYAFSVT